jgi:RNA-directed DNA polymerase
MQISQEIKDEIKIRFANLKSVEDLANLLSYIYDLKFPKRDEKSKVIILEKHLNYYAFKSEGRYKEFSIKKKSGGERKISAPRYKLKTIQKCLNEVFNAIYVPHRSATGFIPQKSIVDNARFHIGKQFVFNTDLKDFFPSTEFGRVKAVLKLEPFFLVDIFPDLESNLPKSKVGKGYLAFIIANLCCEKGCLPQGAPTSPTITNIICQRLDKKLSKFAKSINATYTRYADDITFSSNKPVFNDTFKSKLIEIIEVQENFKINFEKERLQKAGERQVVTGLVVNNKSNVERKYIRDIRFWLMCWKKFDTVATQEKFLIQFPNKQGFLRYGGAIPKFQSYLSGKILFLGMVRGATDAMFLKLKNEYDNLAGKPTEQVKSNITKDLSNFTKLNFDLKNVLDNWENNGFGNAMDKLDI